MKVSKVEEYFVYSPLLILHSWGKRSAAQPQTIYSEIPKKTAWSIFRKENAPGCFYILRRDALGISSRIGGILLR